MVMEGMIEGGEYIIILGWMIRCEGIGLNGLVRSRDDGKG